MNIRQHSIKLKVVLGVLIVLICSFAVAGWYTLAISKEKLYQEFELERAELTSRIAEALAEPIYYLSPNNGSLVLSLMIQDPRIASIDVYDSFNEMEFINIFVPDRAIGDLFNNTSLITHKNEQLGEVKIAFNDTKLKKQILNTRELVIKVFGFTLLTIAIFMFPLMYFIIFKLLNRLISQANSLKRNQFDKLYKWKGNNEIALVGHSFETARIAILKLIDELKSSNKKLELVAITDNLTGLFNRHKLDEVLEVETNRAERYGNKFCVILLDIDYFKQINDTYGHQVGDEVLIMFAKILKQNTRDNDVVSRWGGEEFLVVCSETDLISACQIAEKLRVIIADHKFPDIGAKTASFGVAQFNKSESINELLSKVDEALYKAKENGRNMVVSASH